MIHALLFLVVLPFCFFLLAYLRGQNVGVGCTNTTSAEHGGYRAGQQDHEAAEATIEATDPGFDAGGFLSRFNAAFLQIQKAWQQQDMRPVLHFVSDGVFERFTLQIQEQRDMGYRDHMEQIRVHSALLAEATTSDVFDVLTVQVTASASITGFQSRPANISPEVVRRNGLRNSGVSFVAEGLRPTRTSSA
jgi:hypothetical protein